MMMMIDTVRNMQHKR